MSFARTWLFSVPLILLSTIVLGTMTLIASLFDPNGDMQHRLAQFWAKTLLAVSFVRVRSEGVEKIDPRGSYVFVANHGSLMDIPAALAVLPQQFRFFAKKGLYKIPFLGSHLHRAGHLPVDYTNPRNSLKSMTQGARVVAARGISMLLFPEGGRSVAGLGAFKEGAAYIAIRAGVPIVPVAIIGMRELLPMGSAHLRSGKVIVRVGDPISTKGMTIGNRQELTERLYEVVAEMLAR